MAKYKVYGMLEVDYVIEVEAADKTEAYDKADKMSTIDWTKVETDSTIDIYDMEEIDG